MAAKYLKHQFSIPHHLVPSFEDTAGVVAHAESSAADDTAGNVIDDPLVPGDPVSSLRNFRSEPPRCVTQSDSQYHSHLSLSFIF